jgi:hypothetical protein
MMYAPHNIHLAERGIGHRPDKENAEIYTTRKTPGPSHKTPLQSRSVLGRPFGNFTAGPKVAKDFEHGATKTERKPARLAPSLILNGQNHGRTPTNNRAFSMKGSQWSGTKGTQGVSMDLVVGMLPERRS